MDLEHLNTVAAKPSCSFCQLLLSVAPPREMGGNLSLRSYSFPRVYGASDTRVVLGVIRGESEPLCGTQYLCDTSDLGFCTLSGVSWDGNKRMTRGRRIEAGKINYNVFRTWLTNCKKYHKACHALLLPKPRKLRLIDCETRAVGSLESHANYVALSYVWGEVSSNNLPLVNSRLPKRLPQTVEDAIKVTKELGFRYLWVDQYCINQEDGEEKHRQIKQMHCIYYHAQVTIVQGAGSDSNYGLPGVGNRHRNPQHAGTIQGYTLVSIGKSPREYIESSPWMARGWTYQELFCSNELLIFTDFYVFFECHEAVWRETIESNITWESYDAIKSYSRLPMTNGLLGMQMYIGEYSTRKLTFDSDALNGFLGIFKMHEKTPHPFPHYWGIPVLVHYPHDNFRSNKKMEYEYEGRTLRRTASHAFLSGLCWLACRPGRRRSCFPSWSWIGSTCGFSRGNTEWDRGGLHLPLGQIKVSVMKKYRGMVSFDNVWKRDSEDSTRRRPQIIGIKTLTFELCTGHLSTEEKPWHGQYWARPSKVDSSDNRVFFRVDYEMYSAEPPASCLGIVIGNAETHFSMIVAEPSETSSRRSVYERIGMTEQTDGKLLQQWLPFAKEDFVLLQ